MIAKSVFDALGADTYVINNSPNGVNINTDCGSTHIEHLQKYVVENGLDVGFAFDGDADRCLRRRRKGPDCGRRQDTLHLRLLYEEERHASGYKSGDYSHV